jgi:hypothetical protein
VAQEVFGGRVMINQHAHRPDYCSNAIHGMNRCRDNMPAVRKRLSMCNLFAVD